MKRLVISCAIALLGVGSLAAFGNNYYIQTPTYALHQMQKAAQREDGVTLSRYVETGTITDTLVQPLEKRVAEAKKYISDVSDKSKAKMRELAASSASPFASSVESVYESRSDLNDTDAKFKLDMLVTQTRAAVAGDITNYFEHFDSCTVVSVKRNGETTSVVVKDKKGNVNTLTITSEHKTWKVTGMDIDQQNVAEVVGSLKFQQ